MGSCIYGKWDLWGNALIPPITSYITRQVVLDARQSGYG